MDVLFLFRMEIKVSYVLAVLASLMMVAQVFTSPIGDASQVNKYLII